MIVVKTADANPTLPQFSQAVISKGLVYVSGNIGMTKDFKIVKGGIKAQTKAALENISKVLKAAGSGLEHVVKTDVYMLDLTNDFNLMNEAYAEFFTNTNALPARAVVGVVDLPFGAAIEIECVAEIPNY